jgi:uncharacterized protein YbjT (DUF2867 family)
VTPSTERAQDQQERFVDLAAKAGVQHLVKLSQLAADEGSPVRFLRYHAAVERRIRERGIGFTFLRPSLYFQGLLALSGLIREQGLLPAPIGDGRVSAVDVRDIAAVAAVVLTEPGHTGATYTITGPAAVTHTEIAEAHRRRHRPQGDLRRRLARDLRHEPARPATGLAGRRVARGLPHYSRDEAAAVLPTPSR